MDVLTKALKAAVHQLSESATKQLRSHAMQDGWEPEVANALTVNVTEHTATVEVHDDFATKAFDHEFGTQNHSPKATIRKSQVTDTFKANLAVMFDKELGKIK